MIRYLSSTLLAIFLVSAPGTQVFDLSGGPLASGQTIVKTDSSPPLPKVIRQRGWAIVGESQFGIVLKKSNEQVGEVAVQVETRQCSGELPLTDVDFYYLPTDGQLYVGTVLLAVQNLASYSLDGRIFAYRSAFAKVNLNNDGRREYIGAIFILYYYDEDGDGKFETRYGDLPSLKLPDWYKGK